MKPPWSLLLALAGATLCVALWSGGSTPRPREQRWMAEAYGGLADFALADRDLQRDLLAARAGLLRNYDPLTGDITALSAAAATLMRLAGKDPELLRAAHKLVDDADQRDALTDQFKSDNALLQNSLARLASASSSRGASRAANALSARILRMTLDTGPNAVAEVRDEVSHYERSPEVARHLEAQQLARHARLLIALLPAVDQNIAQFESMRVDEDLERMRRGVAGVQADLAARNHRRKLTLLVVSALIGLLGLGLHLHLLALRRRGENEHLHATILGLLIDAPSGELPGRIERALEQLAEHTGADRAYLLLSDARATSYLWSRDDGLSPLRAAAVVEAVATRREWDGDHILFRTVTAAPSELRTALAGRGPAPASLLLLRSPESEGVAVMGFESDRASLNVRPDTVTGLSTVLAAILQTIHRDRLETERFEFERQLARSRRMETIGALASGVAHNVNNIIAAIAGFSEMAELHVPPQSPVGRSLTEIRMAVARARTLVERVLTFGRRTDSPRERITVDALVDESVRLLRASLPRAIKLETKIDGPSVILEVDAAQLQQVLLNLCHNAALAMPEGGSIRCQAERCVIDDHRRLSHASIDPGDYAVISVSDEGQGIGPAVLAKLFEPFFTTRHNGTGLGLSTAWEIVQDHGGSIDVTSRLGRGSRFAVWLPVASAKTAAASKLPDRGSGETILLVNKDPELLENDEELIAALGYEPVGIATLPPTDALVGNFDAVLIVCLDARSMTATLDAVRTDGVEIPVLIASAQPQHGASAATLHYPFRLHELASALSQALVPPTTMDRGTLAHRAR